MPDIDMIVNDAIDALQRVGDCGRPAWELLKMRLEKNDENEEISVWIEIIV